MRPGSHLHPRRPADLRPRRAVELAPRRPASAQARTFVAPVVHELPARREPLSAAW